MLAVNDKIQIPLRELDFSFSRSSGPGGQHVNKVNTKALLRWDVANTPSLPEEVRERFMQRFRRRITGDGHLLISSQRFRDQGRNVADCLAKLTALILEVATPAKRRKPTRPSAGSRKRRRQEKELQSQKKKLRTPPQLDR